MVFKQWWIPIFIALIINIVLISLIPNLVRRVPEKTDSEYQSFIDVVRLKKPQPPVTPPERKKPPKPEEKPAQPAESAIAAPPLPEINQKIDVQFDAILDIPSIEGTINLPVFTKFNPPAVKAEYALEDIDQPLSAKFQVPPIYPMAARRRGISGWVEVRFLVNEEGFVENIEITSSSPKDVFEDSVIKSVSSWRFNPGTVDGVPVKIRIKQKLEFKLDETN